MPSPVCPDDDRLRAFAAGEVRGGELDEIIEHIDECDPCQARIEQIDEKPKLPPRIATSLQSLRDHEYNESTETIARLLSPRTITARQVAKPKPVVPDRIGPYSIVRKLAAGGMGTVYEARHVNLGRTVAIKLLGDGLHFSRRQAEQVLREWRAHGRLSHPNIVAATDAGLIDAQPYLVTELVDGLDLSKIVSNTGPLLLADAHAILRETSIALAYAHGEGVAHLDVKPSNIMLDTSGCVKVLDLGTARVSLVASDQSRPNEPQPTLDEFGTLGFLAPERTSVKAGNADAAVIDACKADIYSLGCTFHYLLTGQAPFGSLSSTRTDGPTTAELIRAHRKQPPPPIVFRDDEPASMAARQQTQSFVDEMLAKDPAQRPADMLGIVSRSNSESVGASLPELVRVAMKDRPVLANVPTGQTIQLTDLVNASGRPTHNIFRWIAVVIPVLLLLGWVFQSKWSSDFESSGIERTASTPGLGHVPTWKTIQPSLSQNKNDWVFTPRVQSGYLFRSQRLFDKVHRIDPSVTAVAVKTMAPKTVPLQIAWSHDGKRLATLSSHHQLRIYGWDGSTLQLQTLYREDEVNQWVDHFCWNPIDGSLILASQEKLVIAHITPDGRFTFESQDLNANAIHSLGCLHVDGRLLIVVETPQQLIAWDPQTQTKVDGLADSGSDLFESTGRDATYAVRTKTAIEVWHADYVDGSSAADDSARQPGWRFEKRSVKTVNEADGILRFHFDQDSSRLAVFRYRNILLRSIPDLDRRSRVQVVEGGATDPVVEFTNTTEDVGDQIVLTSRSQVHCYTRPLESLGTKAQSLHTLSQARGDSLLRSKIAAHPSEPLMAVTTTGRLEIWNNELETVFRVASTNELAGSHTLQMQAGTVLFRSDGGGMAINDAGRLISHPIAPTDAQLHDFRSIPRHAVVEPQLDLYQASIMEDLPVEKRSLVDDGLTPVDGNQDAFAVIPTDAVDESLRVEFDDQPSWQVGAIYRGLQNTTPTQPSIEFLRLPTRHRRQIAIGRRSDRMVLADAEGNYTVIGRNGGGDDDPSRRVLQSGTVNGLQKHLAIATNADASTLFLAGYDRWRGHVVAVDLLTGQEQWRQSNSELNSGGSLVVVDEDQLLLASWYGWMLLNTDNGDLIQDISPRDWYGFRHSEAQRSVHDQSFYSWQPGPLIEPAAHWSPDLSLRWLAFTTGPSDWIVLSSDGELLASTPPSQDSTRRYVAQVPDSRQVAPWAEGCEPTTPRSPAESLLLVCYHEDGRITVRPFK